MRELQLIINKRESLIVTAIAEEIQLQGKILKCVSGNDYAWKWGEHEFDIRRLRATLKAKRRRYIADKSHTVKSYLFLCNQIKTMTNSRSMSTILCDWLLMDSWMKHELKQYIEAGDPLVGLRG